MYAFALNSATKEHGFKKDENWKLTIANAQEKAEIEQKYYPTVSTQIEAAFLTKLSEMVKVVLNRTPAFAAEPINDLGIKHDNSEYIIAYNPIRVHR